MMKLYIKNFLAAMLLVCSTATFAQTAVSAVADNYMTMAPITIAPGEEIQVPVLLYNTKDIVAFQTIMSLPEGLSITGYTKGSRTSSHDLAVSDEPWEVDGRYEYDIFAYSTSNKSLTGNSGDDIVILTLKADENMLLGDYEIEMFDNLLEGTSDVVDTPYSEIIAVTVTDTTGIDGIEADGAASNDAIYDLTGRKVAKMVKGGIYIKGGKKFIAQI